ncbi:MBL fold metallo-hydrolase [Nocardia rhamnosiphila]
MVKREVADGIHRLEHAGVNVYLIEDEDGVTLVDTGLPATFRHITAALRDIGRAPAEVRAVLLTYAHFDPRGVGRTCPALASPADTGARSVLPGHGEPWTDGVATAVELAVRTGPH